MYFAGVDAASAALVSLEIVPLQIRNFRLVRPSSQDIEWLQQTLDRESRRFGARVVLDVAGRLVLSHDNSSAGP
jgi:poly-gamma-glutamate capsule biosynthesis protein CapA/YwtB (metallophosphatase superfamily)